MYPRARSIEKRSFSGESVVKRRTISGGGCSGKPVGWLIILLETAHALYNRRMQTALDTRQKDLAIEMLYGHFAGSKSSGGSRECSTLCGFVCQEKTKRDSRTRRRREKNKKKRPIAGLTFRTKSFFLTAFLFDQAARALLTHTECCTRRIKLFLGSAAFLVALISRDERLRWILRASRRLGTI